jgi:hypothetical protein
MVGRLLFVAMLIALLVPTAAVAAPPVLLSVGVQSGHATATWSLPLGVQAKVIEIATSPTTGSDGYFLAENRKNFDTLQEARTSWTSSVSIAPGTYYAHVLGLDQPCFSASLCTVREASNVMVLKISAPEPTPAPKPTPKPKPKPPGTLVGARLAGSCDVTERFTSVSGIDMKVGSTKTTSWRFVPQCSRGVCSASVTFRYGHASDILRAPHTQGSRWLEAAPPTAAAPG